MKEKEVSTSQYPKNRLCKKLIVGGIPESEHSVESLTAKMSADLSAHSFQGMSADIVAEVLLYFIAKRPRQASRSRRQGSARYVLVRISASFTRAKKILFKQGLERNDACVWLVGYLTVKEARNALAAVMPGLEHLRLAGRMRP